METRRMAAGVLATVVLLTAGAAGAAQQVITPAPLGQAAAPDRALAFTVG